jgi:DNA-binding transcriptional LysR family regulator
VDTIADLVELVGLGLGVSLLPPRALRIAAAENGASASGRVIGVACDRPIPRELMLVTPLDRELSPAGAALLQLLDSDLQARPSAAKGTRAA